MCGGLIVIKSCNILLYRMAGNFRGIQFSRKAHLQRFRNLIFADGRSRVAPPLTARVPQLRNRPKKQQAIDQSYTCT